MQKPHQLVFAFVLLTCSAVLPVVPAGAGPRQPMAADAGLRIADYLGKGGAGVTVMASSQASTHGPTFQGVLVDETLVLVDAQSLGGATTFTVQLPGRRSVPAARALINTEMSMALLRLRHPLN